MSAAPQQPERKRRAMPQNRIGRRCWLLWPDASREPVTYAADAIEGYAIVDRDDDSDDYRSLTVSTDRLDWSNPIPAKQNTEPPYR